MEIMQHAKDMMVWEDKINTLKSENQSLNSKISKLESEKAQAISMAVALTEQIEIMKKEVHNTYKIVENIDENIS